MIAIAADRLHPPLDSVGIDGAQIERVRVDGARIGRTEIDNARADRTGSLRPIGDILGELLTGYDLAESALPVPVVLPTPVTLSAAGALAVPELALSR